MQAFNLKPHKSFDEIVDLRRKRTLERLFEKIELRTINEYKLMYLKKKILEIEGYGVIKGFDRCFVCYSKLEGHIKATLSEDADFIPYFIIKCNVCGSKYEVYTSLLNRNGKSVKVSYIDIITNITCPYCKKGEIVKSITMVENRVKTIKECCRNYIVCGNYRTIKIF